MAVTEPVTAPRGPSEVEARFRELVVAWKAGRGPSSFAADLARHPAYQDIIALGPPTVPLLLRELEREPDHWFTALRAITGANPVPPESRGRLAEMAAVRQVLANLGVGDAQGLAELAAGHLHDPLALEGFQAAQIETEAADAGARGAPILASAVASSAC